MSRQRAIVILFLSLNTGFNSGKSETNHEPQEKCENIHTTSKTSDDTYCRKDSKFDNSGK